MFGEASQLHLTFPLESSHGFGHTTLEQANIREETHTTLQKNAEGSLCFNLYFIKFVGQNRINQM